MITFGYFIYVLKSGRISGVSAQHCRMILIASGGAAPFDTDGRINGGGFFNFCIISSAFSESMQYGSPRTTTSCMMMPNENTSPGCVPNLLFPFEFRNSSGDVQSSSAANNKIYIKKSMIFALNCIFHVSAYVLPFLWRLESLALRRIDSIHNRWLSVPSAHQLCNSSMSTLRARAAMTNANIASHAPSPSANSNEMTNPIWFRPWWAHLATSHVNSIQIPLPFASDRPAILQ